MNSCYVKDVIVNITCKTCIGAFKSCQKFRIDFILVKDLPCQIQFFRIGGVTDFSDGGLIGIER